MSINDLIDDAIHEVAGMEITDLDAARRAIWKLVDALRLVNSELGRHEKLLPSPPAEGGER